MADEKQTVQLPDNASPMDDSDVDLRSLSLQLDQISNQNKEILKSLNGLQKSVDLVYEDRDLFADVMNAIHKVQTMVLSSDKHNESLTKEVVNTVEKKTDAVQAEVHVTTHEVKNTIINKVVKNIAKNFQKEKATLKKRPWWKRLLFHKKSPTVNVGV